MYTMDKFQYNLFQNIEFTINEAVNEYSKIISSKWSISPEDLKNIWEQVSSNIEFSMNKPRPTTLNNDDNVSMCSSTVSKVSKKTKSPEIGSQCSYIFKRGAKPGSRCEKAKKHGDYCTIHKKHAEDCDASSVTSSVKSQPVKKSVEKVLRKNKDLDKFWHSESRMVFKSKTERVVIGRESSGEILPLSPDDKLVCIKYGFKFAEEEKTPKDELAECEEEEVHNEDGDEEDISNVLSNIKEDE